MRAGDAEIGDLLRLDAAATIRVEGSVRYDPERDHVRALELVVGGKVARVADRPTRPGLITFEADVPIDHTTWIALRSSGDKLDEIPHVLQPIPAWFQTLIDRFGGGWDMSGRDEFLSGSDRLQ